MSIRPVSGRNNEGKLEEVRRECVQYLDNTTATRKMAKPSTKADLESQGETLTRVCSVEDQEDGGFCLMVVTLGPKKNS